VADLAHLPYSQGVPAGPIPTSAAAGDPHLASLPSSSGHMMQQAVVNLPAHMTPGHPSFDQHAYQLLIQQQHQQQQHPLPEQLEQMSEHPHDGGHAAMNANEQGSIKDELHQQQALQMQEPEHASHEGEHAMDGRELDAAGNLDQLD